MCNEFNLKKLIKKFKVISINTTKKYSDRDATFVSRSLKHLSGLEKDVAFE